MGGIDLQVLRLAAGVLVGTLIVSERRRWPPLIAIASAANWLAGIAAGAPLIESLALALVAAVEAWAAARAIAHFARPFSLAHTGHMWTLIWVAGVIALAAGMVSGLVLVPRGAAWLDASMAWWLGGVSGIVLVAPLIAASTSRRPGVPWRATPWRAVEIAIVGAGTVLSSLVVFGGVFGPAVPAYLLPFVFWAVFRFGVGSTAAAVLVFAAIGFLNIAAGRGPFVLPGVPADDWLARAQGSLAIAGASFLMVAATVAERRRIARENLELLNDLEKAIAEIKTLEGFIPICAWCHKVRDDEGFWQQIESYLHERTEATFSHGICPACFTRANVELTDHTLSGRDPS